jgi:Protein of unknown function (DUF429)
MLIIGVDCATDERKTGVALGIYERGRMIVRDARACSESEPAAAILTGWLSGHDVALLALDAPLGWPAPLGDELSRHQAGGLIATEKNLLFRRETDRFIQKHLGKTPLDVGADRIARTAHSALHLLETLRRRLRVTIPLAWNPIHIVSVEAIEVYPAATLRARAIVSSGYKDASQGVPREAVLSGLRAVMDVEAVVDQMRADADVLDAVACLLAAQDFLEGRALPPPDLDIARKEGWIWAAPRAEVVYEG